LLDSLLQETNKMIWSVVSTVVWTVGALPLTLIALIYFRKRKQTEAKRPLQKENWTKDVVYLCQFKTVPSVRSISPFALKLEMWLKMTGITYENIYTQRMSAKGQIPYIELNGEEIADSNIIITTLKKYFNKDPESELSAEEQGISHLTASSIENYLAHTGFLYRYAYKMQDFMEFLEFDIHFPGLTSYIFKYLLPLQIRLRYFLQGISKHAPEEVWKFAEQDLKALSSLLGDKDYFFGSKASTLDCVVFGHLAQFLYIDIGFPQKEVLWNDCKNLVALVERMKALYWADWRNCMPKRQR